MASSRHVSEPFLSTGPETFSYPPSSTLDDRVEAIRRRLKSTELYWTLKRSVKAELIKSKYPLADIEGLVSRVMEDNGMRVQLQNEIFRFHSEAEIGRRHRRRGRKRRSRRRRTGEDEFDETSIEDMLPDPPETLAVVDQTRKDWALFLRDQIVSISRQLGIPLARPAPPLPSHLPTSSGGSNSSSSSSSNSRRRRRKRGGPSNTPTASSSPPPLDLAFAATLTFLQAVEEEDTHDDDDDDDDDIDDSRPKYTGVFSPSKIFEMCFNLVSPNRVERPALMWSKIKLELHTPSMRSLREEFADMSMRRRHHASTLGLVPLGVGDQPTLEYTQHVTDVVETGYVRSFRALCRTGVLPSVRATVWRGVLGHSEIGVDKKAHFRSLLENYSRVRLLVDDMVANDIKRTCDEPLFFVFEEKMVEVMMAFARESWLADHCAVQPVLLQGVTSATKRRVTYPPNGVVPFEGLSMLCGPLCYMYEDKLSIFYVFRELYARFFCKLHVISTSPQTLMPLCKTFEALLMDRNPQLFYHLLSLHIRPLEIAIHWIFHAFAGYLRMDQVLLLWDRMIGFGSMNVLPVLAAAIFLFRAKFLLSTKDVQEIMDCFQDFTPIRVVPLLQMFLFHDE